jgi:hypothetical protein
MSESLTSMVQYAIKNADLLKEITANPVKVAGRFGLDAEETMALRSNNFNTIGDFGRSLRAANHNDGYLS